jgi:glycerophosphoryl diester phosphodiesterase
MKTPAVIAHRGASAHAPENTAAAFRLAARMGADSFETDLRCTRDRRFVLVHDARVNRTTNGRGRVARFESAALLRLDAGRWFEEEFAGQHVLTLEEGLALAEELDMRMYLEIKIPLDEFLRPALIATLLQTRFDRVVLLSFRRSTLRALRAEEPRLKTALLVRRVRPSVRAALLAQATLLAPHRRRVTAPIVAAAHRAGIGVLTWTVNDEREMQKIAAMGVDGIMTNWPDRLTEVLRRDRLLAKPSGAANATVDVGSWTENR